MFGLAFVFRRQLPKHTAAHLSISVYQKNIEVRQVGEEA